MKKLLFAVALALFTATVWAQESGSTTMRELLKKMPDTVVPLLSHNNVLDCIDFVEHDAHAEVTNRMNGKSEMTELTPTLASFFLTSRSTLTLKYFANAGKGGLIYVVNTITTDSLSDSTVTVYNSDWTLASPADQFKFHNPGSYNHVTVSDADNVVRVKEVIRPLLFEGESREDKPDVVTEYTVAVGNKK